MVWRAVSAGVVIAAAIVVGPSAQQPPNFTGVWAAVTDAPETLPAAPSAIFGARFEFKHTGQRLTVVRPVRDFSVATEYGLDGGEVKNVIPGAACFGDSAFMVAVTLKGQSISYRMVASVPPGGGATTPLTLTYSFRLTKPDTLEVESFMRVAGDPNPRTVATVYKRSTDPMPAAAKPIVAAAAPATMADVAWIAGTWTGVNGASNIEERWTPATGGSMLAVSRTHRTTNGAQTAFEFLCIAERGGSLVYTAMPNAQHTRHGLHAHAQGRG